MISTSCRICFRLNGNVLSRSYWSLPKSTLCRRLFSNASLSSAKGRLIRNINLRSGYCSDLSCIRHSWRFYSETPMTTSEMQKFISLNTDVTRDHLTPEVSLHLITPSCHLWSADGTNCAVEDPFWAFYWPGGQALTRYLLDNPDLVRGRRVLDIGSGCGASSIAAVMCKAKDVVANDICPVAIEAIKMNSKLNNLNLNTSDKNFIGDPDIEQDLILLGDMFYDDSFTDFVSKWVEQLRSQGKQVLIGDPGRVYLRRHSMRAHLKLLYQVELPSACKEENNGMTQGYVWEYL